MFFSLMMQTFFHEHLGLIIKQVNGTSCPNCLNINLSQNSFLTVGPKIKILLFPEMRVTRKIFTRAATNLFLLTNLFQFS